MIIPATLFDCVQTNNMRAEVNAKVINVLMGPTFCAAMRGNIRPMMEQPLQIARLAVSELCLSRVLAVRITYA